MSQYRGMLEYNRIKREKAANSFIEKAKEILGEGYDLSETVYGSTSRDKVQIRCVLHGYYTMTPGNVLTGQKCPACARKSQADFHRDSAQDFAAKGLKRHSGKYDYSLVEYHNAQTKVKIICPIHGVFEQTPNSHLENGGCNKCAKEKAASVRNERARQKFFKEVVTLHKDKLDFSETTYSKVHEKLTVRCVEHGYFDTLPSTLLNGSGCKNCAENGYRTNKPGKLYILTYDNLTKIGITNNLVEDRLKRVSKTSERSFNILKQYNFEDGTIPDVIETLVLRELRASYKSPNEKFEGYTETFVDVNLAALLNRIESLISEQHNSQNQP